MTMHGRYTITSHRKMEYLDLQPSSAASCDSDSIQLSIQTMKLNESTTETPTYTSVHSEVAPKIWPYLNIFWY